jgi:hypothetical protein
MEHIVLWVVGASFAFALIVFLFVDTNEPPDGGSKEVPWKDSEDDLPPS